jgi:hypothetical protein
MLLWRQIGRTARQTKAGKRYKTRYLTRPAGYHRNHASWLLTEVFLYPAPPRRQVPSAHSRRPLTSRFSHRAPTITNHPAPLIVLPEYLSHPLCFCPSHPPIPPSEHISCCLPSRSACLPALVASLLHSAKAPPYGDILAKASPAALLRVFLSSLPRCLVGSSSCLIARLIAHHASRRSSVCS